MWHGVAWSIGVVDAPISVFLGGHRPRVDWLSPHDGSFFADPFAVEESGKLRIFAEDYRYEEGRAVISALEWTPAGFGDPPRTVFRRPHHLSYPYVVESEGRRYYVPETAEAREIALYTDGPRGWHRVRVLIADFSGLDPTLLWHDGRWWLFATDASVADQDVLYLWSATSLRDPFVAHPKNPLRKGRFGVRPAGTPFVEGGELFRPGQDGSLRYGQAVVVHRIQTLSEHHFSEEAVCVVGPDPTGPYPDGLHTLAGAGNRTVIDGYRRVSPVEMSWPALRARATSAARSMWRQARGVGHA